MSLFYSEENGHLKRCEEFVDTNAKPGVLGSSRKQSFNRNSSADVLWKVSSQGSDNEEKGKMRQGKGHKEAMRCLIVPATASLPAAMR